MTFEDRNDFFFFEQGRVSLSFAISETLFQIYELL